MKIENCPDFVESKLKIITGFTLVELIIYLSLVSLIAVVSISFVWNIVNARIKNEANQEVEQNLRFGLEKITQAIREADDVSAMDSIFNVSSGKLTLKYPGKDIIFDAPVKIININGQDVEIHKLRIKDGDSDPKDLTSNKIDIINFKLTNLTRGLEPKNIKINLTIKHVNPTQNLRWAAEISSETASSIRK
ncbi:MAG: hypothetical protein AAB465_00510 [Patescibacteria group bacterium]